MAKNVVKLLPQYLPLADKGKPISLGYIYVGEPDTDPTIVGNQKELSVLQEDNTTVVVSQPLRTSVGGLPVYDGAIVTMVVDGDYCLNVFNSAMEQIIYVPTSRLTDEPIITTNPFTVTDINVDVPDANTDGTDVVLQIIDEQTVTGALVANDNITLEILYGGSLIVSEDFTVEGSLIVEAPATIQVDALKTLTINGAFSTEKRKVFYATGDVVFSSNAVVKAIWFGIDTDAVEKAIGSLTSGGRLIFSKATYTVNFASAGTELFEIPYGNTTIEIQEGATIKVTADSSPTSAVEEQKQYVFLADNIDNITVLGPGTFDGNRGAVVNPMAGLLSTTRCSNVKVEGVNFIDVDCIAGCLRFDSYNGTANEFVYNISANNNIIERCNWGINWRNSIKGVQGLGNKFLNMDVGDPTGGETRHGIATAVGRCLRVTGFIAVDETDGNIGDIVFSNNIIEDATYGIEVWNQDSSYGRNPDNAENVVVSNNIIKAMSGIGVNSWSNVVIANNVIDRTRLTAAEVAAYAGTCYVGNTSSDNGIGIEAKPGKGFTVSGNTVNFGYSTTGTDYTGGSYGISIGVTSQDIPSRVNVVGNTIEETRIGLHIQECQNSVVADNTFRNNYISVTSIIPEGTSTYGFKYNTFRNNSVYGMGADEGGSVPLSFYGNWQILGNRIECPDDDSYSTTLLKLLSTSGIYVLKNNLFKNFDLEAVSDLGIDSVYDGNVFDGGEGGGAVGGVTFTRQNNKTVVIGTEIMRNVDCAYSWKGAAGSGESYTADRVILDGGESNLHESRAGGTIYDIPIYIGKRAAVPATGYWSAGTRYEYLTPASAAYIGGVCTVSGTPGTWKDYGLIS